MLTGPAKSRPLACEVFPSGTNATYSARVPMEACQAKPLSLSAITCQALGAFSAHWGLDHCYKHDPVAIVNLILTLFLVFALLQYLC